MPTLAEIRAELVKRFRSAESFDNGPYRFVLEADALHAADVIEQGEAIAIAAHAWKDAKPACDAAEQSPPEYWDEAQAKAVIAFEAAEERLIMAISAPGAGTGVVQGRLKAALEQIAVGQCECAGDGDSCNPCVNRLAEIASKALRTGVVQP